MRETIQNANGKQFHAVSLSGGKDSIRLYRFHWEEIQEPCSHYPQMGG